MLRKTPHILLTLLLALAFTTAATPDPAFADGDPTSRPFYSRWWDRLLGRAAPSPAADESLPDARPDLPLDTEAQRAAALERAEARYATDIENASSLPPEEAEAERERAVKRYHAAYGRIERRAAEAREAARQRELSEQRAQGFRDGSAHDEAEYGDGESARD
jgi:hypothetical protein